jgi:hypothetical protein
MTLKAMEEKAYPRAEPGAAAEMVVKAALIAAASTEKTLIRT